MAPAISKRIELARLCSSKDWSKAIRILDSFISKSGAIQDICNRAFCYSQLELHKHVIKDCDRALQLDPALIQAYILKGRALSALGRKEDALFQWEQGYEHALHRSADIKQLLELEELLTSAKQANNIIDGDHGSPMPLTVLNSHHKENLSETLNNQDKLSVQTELCGNAGDKSKISLKSTDKFSSRNELNDEDKEYNKSDCHLNGSHDVLDKLSYNSESCNDSSDASESCDKISINSNDSIDIAEILGKSGKKFEFPAERRDESRKNKKLCCSGIKDKVYRCRFSTLKRHRKG